MKILAATTTAALLLAGAAHAQTPARQTPPTQTPPTQTPPPASPGRDLTRDLNSGPPVAATYLAPAHTPAPVPVMTPAPAAPTATGARPAAPVPTAVAPRAAPTPQPRAVPATPAPVSPTPAPRVEPPPVSPARAPTVAPAPAPEPVATPAPPPAAAPAVTVLDSAARAALPFSVDLPAGFEIVTGRPGPDFRIYTIRRGERSFVMVYAGPASQFPIYSGQMLEVGGRASIVATEDGVRHAMEHLFQRPDAPREIHVWTMSLDGDDRGLAEQIAQSVDIR